MNRLDRLNEPSILSSHLINRFRLLGYLILALTYLYSLTNASATPPPKQLDNERGSTQQPSWSNPLYIPTQHRSSWQVFLKGILQDQPLISLHYGDSHTQGSFLSHALRDELVKSNTRILQAPSPGFVHQGHPHTWEGHVSLDGHWQRQNWIYSGDIGPFGPLGISFITQARSAQATLVLDRPPQDQPAQVTVFYVDEPGRLGFCLKALIDPDQPLRAEQRRQSHQEAIARYETHFYPKEIVQNFPNEQESDLTRNQLGDMPNEQPLTSLLDSQIKSETSLFQLAENHPQKKMMDELLSETGYCLDANQDRPQNSLETSTLKTLTIPLPPAYFLRLKVMKGEQITDQMIRDWRKKRERARRQKKHKHPQKSTLRPDLIKPEQARLRLLGFHVRYPNAHIEWSSLGVRGARVKSPANRHHGAIRTLAELSNPNLFVLWFGTNSAVSEAVNLTRYEQQFRTLIRELKSSAPQAQCLVITAPDFGRRDAECYLNNREIRALKRKQKTAWTRELLAESRQARVCDPTSLLNMNKQGRFRYPFPNVKNQKDWDRYQKRCLYHTPPLISQLTQVQKQVSEEEGCVLYDTLKAMGGERTIHSWACAQPRWAQLDLIHLSISGYEALGTHIARSLRYEFGIDAQPPPTLIPPTSESNQ